MQKRSSSELVVVVTVSATQIDNIHSILSGIDSQTMLPRHVVFIFDRIDPVDVNRYADKPYQIHIVKPIDPVLSHDDLCYVGYGRNCGVKYVESNIDVYSGVVFVDGDCIPQPELIESHEYVTKYYDIPVVSCGKRREKSIGWRDRREMMQQTKNIGLFASDLLINNNQLIIDGMITWGCNLAMNLSAISMLKSLNQFYYGESTVFNSLFDGMRGGEDTFMGIQATVARVFVHVPKRGGVEFVGTQSQSIRDESNEHVAKILNSFRIKLANKPLPISFFSHQ